MKQISKKDWTWLMALQPQFNELKTELEAIIAEAQAKIDDWVVKAEGIREEAHGIVDDLAQEAQNYCDERSDRWMDSEKGSVYIEWKDELQNAADAFDNNLEFEIDSGSIIQQIDGMIELFDGGIKQTPEE